MTCLLGMALSALGYSGEIVYQDYLDESVLLSAKDREADAYVNTLFDWNCHFESMSLSVVAKISYDKDGGTNSVFRPVVARYDFNGIREPVVKTIRRADKCFDGFMPAGFCMVGLDSFLFSYGSQQSPRTAFMSLSGPTQAVEEVSRKINGMFLHGALSAVERAVFPDGGGFAFQCIGNTNDWSLLLWDRGRIALRPIASNRRVYTCLSGGRVLVDSADDWIKEPEFGLLVLCPFLQVQGFGWGLLLSVSDKDCRGFSQRGKVLSVDIPRLSGQEETEYAHVAFSYCDPKIAR